MSDIDRFKQGEKRLAQAGFELARQNGHRYWAHPDGRHYSMPSTPGEGRGALNMEADLRRLGVAKLSKDHVYTPVPQLVTEALGPAPDHRIRYLKPLVKNPATLQLTVMQVLIAQEMLAGNVITDYGVVEKYNALGKVLMRWLNDDMDARLMAIAYAETLKPDYEVVFRGKFVCEFPDCGRSLNTPASLALHRRKHGLVDPAPVDVPSLPGNRCSICQRLDHKANACPDHKSGRVATTRRTTGTRHCSNCHQPGHYARTCGRQETHREEVRPGHLAATGEAAQRPAPSGDQANGGERSREDARLVGAVQVQL